MSKAPASIKDVASAVGVSIMTVSRAMRGVEGVSAAKRAEIVRAAKKLGYRPNRNAISLAAAHSNLIGISLPTLFNDVFAEILDGMRRTFDTAGFDTVIDTSEYSPEREAAWVERMLDWKPAGVILSGVQHQAGVRERLRQAQIPTLEIWDYSPDPIDICVGFDHEAAGRVIGAHLARCGYVRPAFIGVPLDRDPRAEKRIAGLAAAVLAAGMEPLRVVRIDHNASFEAGMQGTLALVSDPVMRPDVICYINDHMAFGGLATCEKLGLHAPQDIGIVGFNALGINAVLPRQLTTIVTPRRHMGALGARALLARINGAKVERTTIVPTQLFLGATTRAAL